MPGASPSISTALASLYVINRDKRENGSKVDLCMGAGAVSWTMRRCTLVRVGAWRAPVHCTHPCTGCKHWKRTWVPKGRQGC